MNILAQVEGTTWLLLSNGIGKRSLQNSTAVGLVSGAVVGFCVFAVGVQDHPSAVFKDKAINQFCKYFWEGTNLLFYLAVWLMPTYGSLERDTRRPALIHWARFWCLFRFLMIFTESLQDDFDFGYCMRMIVIFIFFAVLKCWVCYRVFVLEAKWWHGVSGSGTMIPGFSCTRTCVNMKDVLVGHMLKGQGQASNSIIAKGQSSNSEEEFSIVAPFCEIPLSNLSASAMSKAMDQMGRARGDSLERSERGDLHSKKDRSSFRISALAGLTASRTRNKTNKRVPLIDFSCLKIVLHRLLGMGSTAKVYEGRWCSRKVAVKVLFTMEITPEDIQRTCLEAALLHSLQSPFVVRLHGIAVLPPSLCVVLEMCSEGSLSDVLYRKEGKSEMSDTRSMLGRFSEYARKEAISRLSSSGQDSDKGRDRDLSKLKSKFTNQFIHLLPWGERLELAVGVAQGVAVLVGELPGTSHNDIKSANYLVDCPNKNSVAINNKITIPGTNNALFENSADDADPTVTMKFVVKLADVEFASVGETPEHMVRGETPNWTAPEVLDGRSSVSPASDIYAVANVLFEIATREVPFENRRDLLDDASMSITKLIIGGRRPTFPKSLAAAQSEVAHAQGNKAEVNRLAIELSSRARFEKIVERAWSQDPASRPEAAALLADLKALNAEYHGRIKSWNDDCRREGALIYKAASTGSERNKGGRIQADSRLDTSMILQKAESFAEF